MGIRCLGGGMEGRRKNPVRVLVLGLGACGKSTFLRQLQIKNNSFNEEENFREVAYQNILMGIQELIRQCGSVMKERLEEVNVKRARFLSEINLTDAVYDDDFFQKISSVWNDPKIQSCWNQRNTFTLQIKHLDYLMANLDRIRSPEYVPTKEDCIYLRQRTTGTVRVNFTSKKFFWEFIDVGGQTSERLKWESILNNEKLDAVVFISSVDEFALYCNPKDHDQSNLHLSIQVFGEIMNNTTLKTIPKILFFNKLDLFKYNLSQDGGWTDFQRAFPDFDCNNPVQKTIRGAIDHISLKFKQVYPDIKSESIRFGSCLDADFVADIFEVICQSYVDAALAWIMANN